MISLEVRDGVAIIWLDTPGSPVNTLDVAAMRALEGHVDSILADDAVRGAVIASRKPDSFIAGVDVRIFLELGENDLALVQTEGHRLFARIAQSPKPFVAAIHGGCAGGGTELALACHWRIASDAPSTMISLPEVRLGVLPGLGGTQRLPRLIGLTPALGMLLTGRDVRIREARRIGLVDTVHHPEGLVAAAVEAARRLAAGNLRRRRKGRGLYGWITDRPPANRLIIRRAEAEAQRTTRGNLPAPARLLDTVRIGLEHNLPAGLQAETEAFGELAATPQARALIGLFLARNKGTSVDTSAARDVRVIQVVGAGFMGSGIAQAAARAGHAVRLVDRDLETAGKGLAAISRRVAKLKYPAHEKTRLLTSISLAGAPGQADLSIEAVPEDVELKRRILRQIEDSGPAGQIIASNTSSIPLGRLADALQRPQNLVGMHYFSPAERMPLLEVVRGSQTSGEALATAVQAGRRQGKQVIVVADSPGFYVNRILAPYIGEAARLVSNGYSIEHIDDALVAAGFPVGPLKLLDEVGLDVAAGVTGQLTPLFAARGIELSDLASRMVAAGYSGRKGGKGFYVYRPGRPAQPNRAVHQLAGAGPAAALSEAEVSRRLLLALVNEAVHALAEGVIESALAGDAGAVYGMGFPPFLGGPFTFIDQQGPGRVLLELQALEQKEGARFAPAPMLKEMAASGRRFRT